MNIFSLFAQAQAANPKAEVTIRSGGHNQIIITWHWDGHFLNRRYCHSRASNYQYGEYEYWRMAFNAAGEVMGQVATEQG